jgi:hypothetical protein
MLRVLVMANPAAARARSSFSIVFIPNLLRSTPSAGAVPY